MTAVLIALASALCYGTSDFVGGVLSTRIQPWTVALCGQLGGASTVALVALLTGSDPLTGEAAAWACLAGVGNGLGTAFLYRGLASGRMGVVAPISGVGAAVVPVLVGLLGGERPAALVWLGILLALPAIYLVARTPGGGSGSAGVLDGAVAGAGFGVGFAAVAQTPVHAGLWPLALNQLVAAVLLVVGATLARRRWLPREPRAALGVVSGWLAATALWLFLEATRHGFLTVTAVIAALYPAATVLLASTVLRERVHRAQAVGLGLCAVAVALVAAG